MNSSSERVHVGHLLAIFFISASSLLLEVCLTRLLAVTLWYHFAFMIISGGLLGFGAAAIVVSLWKRLREAPLDRVLAGIAAIMALSVVATFWLSQLIPLQPFSMSESPLQIFYMAMTYLLLTFPFFLAGLVVSLILTRLVHKVTQLYALDLAGAGVGSVLALVLLSAAGGPGSLVLAAALAATAAMVLAWRLGPRERLGGTALVLLLVILSLSAEGWLPLRISSNKGLERMSTAVGDDGEPMTRWSPIGRVDVLRSPGGELRIFIDGGVAVTRVPHITGDVEAWRPPAEGMRAAMVNLDEHPRVLIIGSGGGYEVAAALALGAGRVEAVEMNEAIVELVRRELDVETGGIFRDRRVALFADEGRSYVSRSTEPVDLIACVHTISNSAWASGALSLAENYVLTVEAMEGFLGHLTPRGALWLTRPEAQLPRLVATVRAALERQGVADAARHIIAYRKPGAGRSFLGGLIVGKRPFTADQVASVQQQLRRDRLQPLLLPGRDPRGLDARAYRAALDADEALRFQSDLGLISPTSDERPYFNQRLPWSGLGLDSVRDVLSRGQRGRMAMEDAPVAEVAVLIVLAWACLFSTLLVVFPLMIWRRRGEKVELGAAFKLVPYFATLGLGYITVEVCLIQRFGLFVGRPEYALATVLASMLVGSGAGSMVATRWTARPRRAALLALAATAVLIAVHARFGPDVNGALLGLSLTNRMIATFLLVAPLGFVMGMPLPLGLRAAPGNSPHLLAWVFGLNCAVSVVGSSLSVILSSSLGFAGTLFVAAMTYVVAAATAWSWKAQQADSEVSRTRPR